MSDKWKSVSCGGETCHLADCDKPAFAKVGEEIMRDDPAPARHNLTAYVCEDHFAFIFGARGVHFRNRWIENKGGPGAITHALLNHEFPHSDGPDNSSED